MGRGIEETLFFQRRYTDGQQAYKKILNITNLQEMQIKMLVRQHFTPVRMAFIKKQ